MADTVGNEKKNWNEMSDFFCLAQTNLYLITFSPFFHDNNFP